MNHTLTLLPILLLAPLATTLPAADAAPSVANRERERVELKPILANTGVQGGLIVYAGNGDLAFPPAWREQSKFLVQQLVSDHTQLPAVRARIREQGFYGQVSAVSWDGGCLPYADDTVNLLVLPGDSAGLPRAEIERVLVPRGVAQFQRGGEVSTYRKPWPEEMDEWTHARHDSTGNASSSDRRVGPPRHLQWYASPRWNPSSKSSVIVSAGGKVFCILNDATHFNVKESPWGLVARDAFNGVLLWRRELPAWEGAGGDKKVGPVQTDRKLVASTDKVFAPLAQFAPVSILDAATGEVLRTLENTKSAEEILLSGDVLVVLANPNRKSGLGAGLRDEKIILAHKASSGELLWQHPVKVILPDTLAADQRQVVYHDGKQIVSLDLTTGRERWASAPTGQRVNYSDESSPRPDAAEGVILVSPQYAPNLMIYGDVIAMAGGGRLQVISAENGHALWTDRYSHNNYCVPAELFGFGDRVWGPLDLKGGLAFNGWQLLTGSLAAEIKGDYGFRFAHHRCYQMKAAGDYILASRAGIEFVNTRTGQIQAHHWIRGSCYAGVMPANGTLYVPPHNCACFIRAKLAGFWALRSARSGPSTKSTERLERGPAYSEIENAKSEIQNPEDWPTYRHDAARSGRATTTLTNAPKLIWKTHLGGKLTAPVIADGRVFLASTDSHRLFALDAKDGKILWDFTCNGRVDSPPTIWRGMLIAGSRDGWVYALRATDGVLAWRFRVAPQPLCAVSEDQLESVWPVHGSVLLANDVLYCAAGRSSYLDGGIHFYGLEPRTGKVLAHRVIDSRQEDGSQTSDTYGPDGVLNDILAGSDAMLFMRHQALDRQGKPKPPVAHLFSPDGYLSDNSTVRLSWTYAPTFTSLAQGAGNEAPVCGALFPSGRILVDEGEFIYGYGQDYSSKDLTEKAVHKDVPWQLFKAPKKQATISKDLTPNRYRAVAEKGKARLEYSWRCETPVNVWAMLHSGPTLFVAGPDKGRVSGDDYVGQKESKLLAIDASVGRLVSQVILPSAPVWDGMAAAAAHIFIATRDGHVLNLGDR